MEVLVVEAQSHRHHRVQGERTGYQDAKGFHGVPLGHDVQESFPAEGFHDIHPSCQIRFRCGGE